MIKKKGRIVWVASDGTEFDTYEEAFRYDLVEDVKDWINHTAGGFLYPDSDLVYSIAEIMVNDRRCLAAILEKGGARAAS